MRNYLSRNSYGFFTAEAAVMFPFLIFLTILFFYLLIFLYDKTLVLQDMNSLEASLKSSERDFYYTYREIEEQHPYIAVDKVSVSMEKRADKRVIRIKCNWIFPLAGNMMRSIELEREVKLNNPCEIMIMTEGIIGEETGGGYDKDKSIK